MNEICKHYEQVYAISFSILVKFSQSHAKNIHKGTRQSYHLYTVAMVINENYNSNMFCCMNNKQLIK